MRYVDAPILEEQRKPLVPSKIISGMLPGATQIRIGGDDGIMIDGKNRKVSVSSGDSNVSLGKTSSTTLGINFIDNDGVTRFLAGVYPDSSVKMKLSQATYDVSTATDDQLIWSSDFNLFKIIDTDTVDQTLTNVANTVSKGSQAIAIPHTLGITPSFLVYMTAPSGFVDGAVLFQLPHTTFYNDGGINDGLFFTHFYATVNSTDLTIHYIHGGNTDYSPSVPTFSVRYYLLRETAN